MGNRSSLARVVVVLCLVSLPAMAQDKVPSFAISPGGRENISLRGADYDYSTMASVSITDSRGRPTRAVKASLVTVRSRTGRAEKQLLVQVGSSASPGTYQVLGTNSDRKSMTMSIVVRGGAAPVRPAPDRKPVVPKPPAVGTRTLHPQIKTLHERLSSNAVRNIRVLPELKKIPMIGGRVVVEALPIRGLPGLHSYVAGHGKDGRWLLIGGITAGVHGAPPEPFGQGDFERSKRNQHIWVVDPTSKKVWSVPLRGSKLTSNQIDALSASNAQAAQTPAKVTRGDVMWIVGGYGWSNTANEHVTFGYLIGVAVDQLTQAIVQHNDSNSPIDLRPYFAFGAESGEEMFTTSNPGSDSLLTVTGGGMQPIDGTLYLVLGQRFAGAYNDYANHQQRYSCRIVRFSPPVPKFGQALEIPPLEVVGQSSDMVACCDGNADTTDHFHRRDLSVRPAIFWDKGKPLQYIQVLGGVFATSLSAHARPVYVRGNTVKLDPTSANDQLLCQYETAAFGMFTAPPVLQSPRGRPTTIPDLPQNLVSLVIKPRMETVLLGGMSGKFSVAGNPDGTSSQLADATFQFGPPYVADGTIMAWYGGSPFLGGSAGTTMHQTALHRPFNVPPTSSGKAIFLGANAHFIIDHETPHYSNGVIKYDKLPKGKTLVGYIYGGLEAHGIEGDPDIGYTDTLAGSGVSFASRRAFKVSIMKP